MSRINQSSHRVVKILLSMALVLLTPACGWSPWSSFFASDDPDRLVLVSTKNLNQDDNGDAHPVVVRICQLRAKGDFETAPFEELVKRDQDRLGDEFVTCQEHSLFPASKQFVELAVDPEEEVHYLGVMALFHQPAPEAWRVMIPIPEERFWEFRRRLLHKVILIDTDTVQVREPV